MVRLQAYMATQQEITQARAWLEANRTKVPPVLGGEIGTRITYKQGRSLPIVSFAEDNVGHANHRLNATGHETLLPWPGPDAVRNTISLRPVEDQLDI